MRVGDIIISFSYNKLYQFIWKYGGQVEPTEPMAIAICAACVGSAGWDIDSDDILILRA